MVANLKLLRCEKNISQQDLATELEISQQSINKYENHKIEPDIYMLMKMADYFETSIDYLVGYTDIRHKIESVSPYDLNADEASLIEKYRLLSPKERESIQMVMQNYMEK